MGKRWALGERKCEGMCGCTPAWHNRVSCKEGLRSGKRAAWGWAAQRAGDWVHKQPATMQEREQRWRAGAGVSAGTLTSLSLSFLNCKIRQGFPLVVWLEVTYENHPAQWARQAGTDEGHLCLLSGQCYTELCFPNAEIPRHSKMSEHKLRHTHTGLPVF